MSTDVGTLTGDVDSDLIARTARKRWRCYAFDSSNETPSLDCVRDIEVGTRYVEYLGATYAFQPGHHYCAPCAAQIWHVAPGKLTAEASA